MGNLGLKNKSSGPNHHGRVRREKHYCFLISQSTVNANLVKTTVDVNITKCDATKMKHKMHFSHSIEANFKLACSVSRNIDVQLWPYI